MVEKKALLYSSVVRGKELDMKEVLVSW